MIIVVSLAGCGPTASAPTRTAATAPPLGLPATPLALATALPQTVAPTTYVRYVAPTNELWVTEPDQEQIEVFTLSDAQKPVPVRASAITVKGGPESLAIDPQRQRAYTHLWAGATVAIDLKNRTLVAQWPNGCGGSRGIAPDSAHGWLFAGCAEGVGVVLDIGRNLIRARQQRERRERGARGDRM